MFCTLFPQPSVVYKNSVFFYRFCASIKVVGVVILLGPRLEALVSAVLEIEARKRSRFPPGLEPHGAPGTTRTAAKGVGNSNVEQVQIISEMTVMFERMTTNIRADRLIFGWVA